MNGFISRHAPGKGLRFAWFYLVVSGIALLVASAFGHAREASILLLWVPVVAGTVMSAALPALAAIIRLMIPMNKRSSQDSRRT